MNSASLEAWFLKNYSYIFLADRLYNNKLVWVDARQH